MLVKIIFAGIINLFISWVSCTMEWKEFAPYHKFICHTEGKLERERMKIFAADCMDRVIWVHRSKGQRFAIKIAP